MWRLRRTDWYEPEWAEALGGLVQRTEEQAQDLAAQAEQDGEAEAKLSAQRYRLVLRAGLRPRPAADSDAQKLWSGPSSKSKKMGLEESATVDVVEERKVWAAGKKELWLRLPGATPRWLKRSCPNGSWEPMPRHNATELQTDFLVESGLRLLIHSIDSDAAASAVLLESTLAVRPTPFLLHIAPPQHSSSHKYSRLGRLTPPRSVRPSNGAAAGCGQFAARLQPLSLFDSSNTTIERSLSAVMEWLTSNAAKPEEGDETGAESAAATALLALVQLTVARGTLPSILNLARFLSTHPHMAAIPGVLDGLGALWEPDGFEPALAQSFVPPPGSNADLLCVWEELVFPSLSKEAPDSLPELTDALLYAAPPQPLVLCRQPLTGDGRVGREGDSEAARDLAREKLSAAAFAPLRMPTLEQLACSADAVAYAESVAEVSRLDAEMAAGQPTELGVMEFALRHAEILASRLR